MQHAVTKCTRSSLVVALVALVAWPWLSSASPLAADTSASRLVIRASKKGVLSFLAHDHEFTPARWRADVDFDPSRPQDVRVDVRIDAATLHDQVARLSQTARDHVDRETAGPAVLDAQRYGEIRLHAESASARAEGDGLRGLLHGALTLHGTTRPLDVPFVVHADATGHRVSGTVRFRQTDYGITPISKARGSIGVDDEVQVEFELVLVPAPEPTGSMAHVEVR
jgi:polyisoprenoid-binding protein YceI